LRESSANTHDNTCIGNRSGRGATGSCNVIIGSESGYWLSGSNNVFIGYNAGKYYSENNKLVIANSDTSTPLIYGDFSTDELTINGRLEVTEDIKLTASLSSSGEYSGSTATMTVNSNSVGFGCPLYVTSSGVLEEANATSSGTMPCFAMACETGTGSKIVLLQGFIKNSSWAWVNGQRIFINTGTGTMTQEPPTSSGTIIQIIGMALDSDKMYFNPEYTMIERG